MLCDETKSVKNSLGKMSITLGDLLKAENIKAAFCQRQRYPEEITRLEKTQPTMKGVSRLSGLYKLDPILEDRVLRVDYSAMPEEAKHPVILPKDLQVSTLTVQHIHKQHGHSGRLRKRLGRIINTNSAVAKVMYKL